jgi:hypothetical protein
VYTRISRDFVYVYVCVCVCVSFCVCVWGGRPDLEYPFLTSIMLICLVSLNGERRRREGPEREEGKCTVVNYSVRGAKGSWAVLVIHPLL